MMTDKEVRDILSHPDRWDFDADYWFWLHKQTDNEKLKSEIEYWMHRATKLETI